MRAKFAEIMNTLLKKKKYLLLLGDISVGFFLDKNNNLYKNVYNLGVLEQSMISFSAGLSRGGLVPFVHTISPFLIERAYEQIKLDIDYNQNKVILVSANGPYDYNKLGPTHHCSSDVPLIHLLENINIYLPGTIHDVKNIVLKACASKSASYIRLTSRYSVNKKIKHQSIIKKTKKNKALNIFFGEAINYAENKNLFSFEEDWIYSYELFNLNIKKFLKYKELNFWEPYSYPVAAYYYRSKLNSSIKINSFIYPKSIKSGIFKQPKYQKIII